MKKWAFICLTVCLPDSVLAFHKHGMQGRSFKNGDITQEITDASRTYKLLGSDKYFTVKMHLYCLFYFKFLGL